MNTAYVNIWGKRVGAVAWDDQYKLASFEYDPKFIGNNWDIAPKLMPLNSIGRIFSFPQLMGSQTFKGLPGLLADVLPDKYGNALINAWLIKQGRTADSMNPVEMLCFIGKRGMGALEFEPVEIETSKTATKLEISELIRVAGDILNDRVNFSADINADEKKAMLDILKIGTSAGGARAKALIAYNAQTGEVRSGQATAPKGFEHWLIKFDGVHDSQFGASYGFGRVEMAYHLMAKDCGIEMAECRLLEENGRAHFMTKRFDRIGGQGKVHVQTWCGLSHYDFMQVGDFSYEALLQDMRILGLPFTQAQQLFKRMVFNVLGRNCDDHTKNFSFIMPENGIWALSPAYDICHAYRPGSYWVNSQSLSINGKRADFTREDLLMVARQASIKTGNQIIDEIQAVINNWDFYADQVNVDRALQKEIKSTLLNLKK